MKKRAALLVALSLAVVTVLAGCGGKDSSKSADSKDSAATFEEKKEGKSKRAVKIAGLNKFLRIYYARVMEVYQK